jgi:hypothetical protein
VGSGTRLSASERSIMTQSVHGEPSVALEVRGLDRDLHSDHGSGAVHHLLLLQAFCAIITMLHDRNGGRTIPGF